MNAQAKIAENEIPTVPGTPFGGGFYAGRIMKNGIEHAVIVAPKAEGDHDDEQWGEYGKEIEGASSFFDGAANTRAMAAAGYPLAVWALALVIAGFNDWHLPSRDELEIYYRNLKPGTQSNWRYRGDNPSSVPVGYPYSPELPAQTACDEFKADGAEAFEQAYYWSSTQYSAKIAWAQDFSYGYVYYDDKSYEFRARAVRTIPVGH